MDEMVVMESLDLEDFKAGMERMDYEVRQEPLDHRGLLDPAVEDLLTSGGVERLPRHKWH